MRVAGPMPQSLRGLVGTLAAFVAAVAAQSANADIVPSTGAAPSTSANGPNATGAEITPALPSTANRPAPAVVSAKPMPLPPGQVWECMVNGQRTFSDVRCGAQSSIRQLGAVNIMDATSTRPAAPFGLYPTGYAPRPNVPMAPDDSAADDANDTYWGPAIVSINQRAMRGHRAPHANHGHARASRN